MPEPESAPVACTLSLQAMAARLAEIRQLTREHLRSHRLEGRILRLTYDAAAAARVAHIVELERACCAFLHFELQVSPSGAELTIAAPEQDGTDAQWLFEHFLPGPDLPDASVRETSPCAACRG